MKEHKGKGYRIVNKQRYYPIKDVFDNFVGIVRRSMHWVRNYGYYGDFESTTHEYTEDYYDGINWEDIR